MVIALKAALYLCLLSGAQVPDLPPSAELKKLGWYVGEWDGRMKLVMPGMEGEGTISYKNVWDGQFIKSTATISADEKTFVESIYIGWNPGTKRYESHAFTAISPGPRIEHGDLRGDVLTMVSRPWVVMGIAAEARNTTTKRGAHELHFLLELKTGERFTKVAEGIFKRKRTK